MGRDVTAVSTKFEEAKKAALGCFAVEFFQLLEGYAINEFLAICAIPSF